jgi:hypothetical protein
MVKNAAGEVVAAETLAAGQTFEVAVGPGEYSVSGSETNASGGEAGCESAAVVAAAGEVTPVYCWVVLP